MKIRLLWIGKTKNRHTASLLAELEPRITRLAPLEIVEVREPGTAKTDREQVLLEGAQLLKKVTAGDFVIALDPSGRQLDSRAFAQLISRHFRENPKHLTFVIGGFAGLSEDIRKRADLVLSLSSLTFTHELTRLVLLEQIYRALAIMNNLPFAR